MLFIILAALSLPAFASEKDGFPDFFCHPAKRIQPPSENCGDNAVFVRAAEMCLARLRGEVSAEGAVVSRFFSKKAKDRQSQNFHESSFNHAQASLRLARLIRLAKKAALELDTYYDNVYFPIDYELPAVNGGNVNRYLMSQACYGETVRSIESVINDVIEVGRELTAAKKEADSIGGRLDAREGKLENSSAGVKAGGAHGQGSRGRVPTGKSAKGASTITGEIRKQPDLTKQKSK